MISELQGLRLWKLLTPSIRKKEKYSLGEERVNVHLVVGFVPECLLVCALGCVLYQVLNEFLNVKDWGSFVYLLPDKVFKL